MKDLKLDFPVLGMIAGTRFLLGVGVGLLLAHRFSHQQRHSVGWTLVTVGALTTIPLAVEALNGKRCSHDAIEHNQSSRLERAGTW